MCGNGRGPMCRRIARAGGCILRPSDCIFGGRTRVLEPQGYCDIDVKWMQASKVDPRSGTGFLDLPRELRDRIYAEILYAGKSIHIGAVYLDVDTPCHWHPSWAPYWSTSCALLRTCRQLHNEAAAVLYGSNRFGIACSWAAALDDPKLANEISLSRLRIIPFHPAYHQFARNVSFSSYRNNFFQDLGVMMVHLINARGAYFHVYGDLYGPSNRLERFRSVAGWSPITPDPETLLHPRAVPNSRAQLKFVTTGNNIIDFLRRLAVEQGVTVPLGCPNAEFKALRQMQYQVQVDVTLNSGQTINSAEDLLRCDHLSGLTFAFTPVLTEHAQQYQDSYNAPEVSAAQLVQNSVYKAFMQTGCSCLQLVDLGWGWYERTYSRTRKCSSSANQRRIRRERRRELERHYKKEATPSLESRVRTAVGKYVEKFTERMKVLAGSATDGNNKLSRTSKAKVDEPT